MKKLFITTIMLTLLAGIVFADGKPVYWKNLKKQKVVSSIKCYYEKMRKVKTRFERQCIVELAQVRKALEKAGVSETVTIELRNQGKIVGRLGTYTPMVAESQEGKTLVSFESMPVGMRIPHHPKLYKTDFRIDAQNSGEYSTVSRIHLVFKNAKGKIKVKLLAGFGL